MYKTTFRFTHMDCPSEEQLIRMKLDGMPAIRLLTFDIPNRRLEVVHEGSPEPIIKNYLSGFCSNLCSSA